MIDKTMSATDRAGSAVAASAVNGDTFAGLQSVVADLEKLLDLVEGRRLEVLDGDVVDGEPVHGAGRRRHLRREADQVGNLVVVTSIRSFLVNKRCKGLHPSHFQSV